MKEEVFLEDNIQNNKDFNNLLSLTGKMHGESLPKHKINSPLWNETFFELENSSLWKGLDSSSKEAVLLGMSQKILQEAFFIECAGMAFSAKMNLSSLTKEERQFYCFVAEEEAKHLRLIESIAVFDSTLKNIPTFSQLMGEIVAEASRSSHLLIIQILLEGWGLHYYKSLAKNALHEEVASLFKQILKDEIRHHTAGVLLFSENPVLNDEEKKEFLDYLQRLVSLVKIGPYGLCQEVFSRVIHPSRHLLMEFLKDTGAVESTREKLNLISDLLSKSLPKDFVREMEEKKIFKALAIDEMTEVLYQSIPGIAWTLRDH